MYFMQIGVFPRHPFLSNTSVADPIAKWIGPFKTVELHQISMVKDSELEYLARR